MSTEVSLVVRAKELIADRVPSAVTFETAPASAFCKRATPRRYAPAMSSFAIDLGKVVGIQVGGSVHRVSDVSIVQATTGSEAAPLTPGQCVLATVAAYGQQPERLLVPLEQVQAYILKP